MKVTVGRIDITGCDLRQLLRAAYRLSRPQGLGFLHAREGELDDVTVDEILARSAGDKFSRLSADYVHGRSLKLRTMIVDGRLYLGRSWYDHSRHALQELLAAVGLSPELVERAEAEYAAALEQDLSDVLAELEVRGGSYIRDVNKADAFFDERWDALYEAQRRGLVTQTYVDRVETWAMVLAEARS